MILIVAIRIFCYVAIPRKHIVENIVNSKGVRPQWKKTNDEKRKIISLSSISHVNFNVAL